jgi:phosphatidylglycerol---prolipoprotein diacylglyceryl transferase
VRGELFRVFDIAFPAYFVFLLSGFLFATAAGALAARRWGKDPDVIVDLGLSCLLMGVIGGRLLSVLADGYFMDFVNLCFDPSKVEWKVEQALCASKYKGVWDSAKAVCHPRPPETFYDRVSYCLDWAMFWKGGLTYYGGFIGASIAAFYLLKRDRFPFWKAADIAGFAVPLGLGFGRMGCLLAGCCFGHRSESALALSFPKFSPASKAQFERGELPSQGTVSHPVLPTQIFESAMSLAIAAVCMLYVYRNKRYDGQVFVVFLGSYAVGRFLLEFLRADDRGGLLSLSTSQLIGIAILGLAVVVHLARTRAQAASAPSPA